MMPAGATANSASRSNRCSKAIVSPPNELGAAVGEAAAAYLAQDLERAATGHVGRRIGPYQLVRMLGRGGMGTVYEAVRADDQYRQSVAMKFISQGFDNPESIARFRNERQILATLQHPNIAALLDGGTTADGQPYIVMEFIEGEPIVSYCRRKNLAIPERLELFRALCAAVHHAHQMLVIHRDIKPANVLVTVDGIPKLLDFGIAKLIAPENAADGAGPRTVIRILTPGVRQSGTASRRSPDHGDRRLFAGRAAVRTAHIPEPVRDHRGSVRRRSSVPSATANLSA